MWKPWLSYRELISRKLSFKHIFYTSPQDIQWLFSTLECYFYDILAFMIFEKCFALPNS
jgi:hypothetical protein